MNTGIPNLSIEALFRARALARIAHQGQTDRLNDPLFDHLERVAQRTTTPYTRALAYLHDIVEDSTVTLTEIATFFDAPLARDVDALTRRTDETYARYIERIAQASAAAREVKLADLADHLRAPLRIPQSLERRYRRAQQALLAPPDPEPPAPQSYHLTLVYHDYLYAEVQISAPDIDTAFTEALAFADDNECWRRADTSGTPFLKHAYTGDDKSPHIPAHLTELARLDPIIPPETA